MPSETPEPTQEQRCVVCGRPDCQWMKQYVWAGDGSKADCYRLGYERLAAEAAPLREEIERLTKDVASRENEARVMHTGWEQERANADSWADKLRDANAKVLSLEEELDAWKLAKGAGRMRAEIEKLTKERDEARDQIEVMGSMELTGKGALMLNGDAIKRADAAEAKVLSLEAEIEKLKAPRMFPLQTELRSTKYPKQQFTRIPWAIAERAYATYSARYGKDQSLERLAERGGFGQQEMDDFYPPWRDELAFPAQILALEKQLSDALAAASRAREEQGALRAALGEIVNASYTEFRPIVEHYGPDPTAEAHIYPGGVVHRSHATEQEWALARKVAGYLQGIASAALAPPAAESQENQQQLTKENTK